MKLYLVRHGESISSDIDPNQPLSTIGKQQTEQVANLLKETDLKIDEILHSVKLRAKQTAEILAFTLFPNLPLKEREGLKPMDPVETIIDELQGYKHNLMIVGHLPFMEKLLTQLVLQEERDSPLYFSGSVVICLDGEKRSWVIEWVISPKVFAKSQKQAKSSSGRF